MEMKHINMRSKTTNTIMQYKTKNSMEVLKKNEIEELLAEPATESGDTNPTDNDKAQSNEEEKLEMN